MHASLNWLKEYVDISLSARELADKLTMAGLEVEGIESFADSVKGVVVAQVLKKDKHPNADKLSVTTINYGAAQPIQVVCGAKNFKEGDKVPLATVGTQLPNGVRIQVSQLRGVESNGMLCSAKELGLTDSVDGLMILDPQSIVGEPIAKALERDDSVLVLNVTANRPDALSHIGLAQEISALTGAAVHLSHTPLREAVETANQKLKVTVEAQHECFRYTARVVEGVKVGPSPGWMRARLESCGVRSINNIVDVTNYVMLEYGHPLHAFDGDLIAKNEIVVRLAKPGEKLQTLDEKIRELHADDLVIADAEKALVLAGVMGGATSEVSDRTTRVVLECAAFLPSAVRRASKRHALHSESSHRFERGVDVNATIAVIDRAASLLHEIAGGTPLKGHVDAYAHKKEPLKITFRLTRVEAILGADIAATDVQRILTNLGFGVEKKLEEVWLVTIPGRRVDVTIEEDLVEEVARVYGYERILMNTATVSPMVPALTKESQVVSRIRQALSANGFDEVVNYSFVSKATLAAFEIEADAAQIENPLSVEQALMRTGLLPGLVSNVIYNQRHESTGVRLYEMGKSYSSKEGQGGPCREVKHVAGVLWGERLKSRRWTEPSKPVDFYDAKAAIEALARILQISNLELKSSTHSALHPRAAAELFIGSERVGLVGELSPIVAKRMDAPKGIFAFELDLDAWVKAANLLPQGKSLSKFPSVFRDIAVVVDSARKTSDIRSVILEVGAPLVVDANVFDVYTGAPIAAGQKNVAYALTYHSEEATLTDEKVNEAHQRIVAEVNKRLGAQLRT